MGKADVYLIIGRTVIALYLIIIFIMVIAESVQRSNYSTNEPANYKETVQVMNYVTQNFASTPLSRFEVLDTNASDIKSAEALYTWSVSDDWCSCTNTLTHQQDMYPHLGICSAQDSTTENCTSWQAYSNPITNWKGSYIKTYLATDASYPISTNHTCESSFATYNPLSNMCAETSKIISDFEVVNETSPSNTSTWTFVGSFASYGNSTPPINKTHNDSKGLDVYVTYTKAGSPFINIKASLNGLPCLNPQVTPAPSDYHSAYPLTGNASAGCGYWNTSEDLYETIDKDNEWDFFLNDDLASGTSFYTGLFGFANSTINEYVYLYAERKLIVADTDFCYNFIQNSDAQTNINDVANLASIRRSLCVFGFIVSILGFLVFIIYLIATRATKTTTKERVGIYIFWFEHGLGCLYACMAIMLGVLTDDLTQTIEDDNSYLTTIASNNCIYNVPKINDVYTYLSNGILNLYSYIDSYNTAGVIIAIIFLVLELIILIWWLIGFSCHENLDEEEIETKKLQTGSRS